jgi:predicted 3-demethylubiquinone-9 3-methyltransferase (glyoxalase superfamily)
MPPITPFLWFDDNAEEAVVFYISIFPNSRIASMERYGENTPGEPGKVMTIDFELDGTRLVALNGGPVYAFTPAVSLFISCREQAEVNHYWDNLSAGGEVQQCGWLTDRFRLSWQVAPEALGRLMSDPDPERVQRVVQAMLKMVKLDVAELQRAYDG